MASTFNFKTDNYLINETNKTACEQMYFRIFTRNNKTHLNIYVARRDRERKIVCENDFLCCTQSNLICFDY